MSTVGISLNAATSNEASVATFARSGASAVRFIAKGMAPNVYVALAETFRGAGTAVRKDFEVIIDLPGERPRMGSSFDEKKIFQGMTVLLVDEFGKEDTFRGTMLVPTVDLLRHKDLFEQGDRLLISDGETELRILDILPNGVLAEATHREALLSPNRSILLPDTDLRYRSLSDADLAVARAVAASPCASYAVAVSMVESAAPLAQIRDLLPDAKVIAKVETRHGLLARAEIVAAADSVMLARGDLGLSLGLNFLPAALELFIEECQRQEREMILATGLFDGVYLRGRPTIADLTDLWYYWKLGIRDFLLSGGRPDLHGRQSIHFLADALGDFRFAAEDLVSASE